MNKLSKIYQSVRSRGMAYHLFRMPGYGIIVYLCMILTVTRLIPIMNQSLDISVGDSSLTIIWAFGFVSFPALMFFSESLAYIVRRFFGKQVICRECGWKSDNYCLSRSEVLKEGLKHQYSVHITGSKR